MNDAHTLTVSPRGLKLELHDTSNDCIDVRPRAFGRYVLNSEHIQHTRSQLELLASLWNDQGLRWLMRPDQVEKIAAVLGIQGSYDELVQDKRRVELEPC